MTSTPAERFVEVQRVFRDADANRGKDLKDAKSKADVNKVIKNLDAAEALYLRAGKLILEKNGPTIEKAYKAAKAANDVVATARKEAVALAERIRKVSAAISSVGDLVKKTKA